MPTVRELIARKPTDGSVVAVASTDTVLAAAHLMNERGIGGVVVLEAGRLTGIFTERDVMRRVVAERRDPETTTVGEVMTSPVLTVTPETTMDEVRQLITERRIRHLPVVGDAGLAGVVTIGDVLAWEVAEQRFTIQHLENYVYYQR
ncbi:MAG TPA: CBS domain-containing protein [Gemmatirosa sp.]|nr:CBS domain-containing protein [Gemmatirosa sp.]